MIVNRRIFTVMLLLILMVLIVVIGLLAWRRVTIVLASIMIVIAT